MQKTVFTNVTYTVSGLMSAIGQGQIALPDLQRPFVWPATNVRDLFDSMYRGYPIGYLLFWSSGAEPGTKQIGTDAKDLAAQTLIVDGQQRLTSLFAVFTGTPVVDANGDPRKIRIAFKPRDGSFAVADATTDKNPEYLGDISSVWEKGSWTTVTEFLTRLREATEVDAVEEEQIASSISQLFSLNSYSIIALVLDSEVPVDQVAEVFVRINSKGKQLSQADFILTLMSVYWNHGRHELEDWCASARTEAKGTAAFIEPSPDQMLRVVIALGMRRARLEDAYTVLRGRDPDTGKITDEARERQFAILQDAQKRVLDPTTWSDFRQVVVRAGHQIGRAHV